MMPVLPCSQCLSAHAPSVRTSYPRNTHPEFGGVLVLLGTKVESVVPLAAREGGQIQGAFNSWAGVMAVLKSNRSSRSDQVQPGVQRMNTR